ncbi:MAG: tetratricopeptide repeat protein [Sphingobacteriales bacterium]|nr:MAG: tetratricopeptide repeat protein [Sphingobacteriales bacterium]
MKYLLYLAAFFVIACNDAEKGTKPVDALPAKEAGLLKQIEQFPDSLIFTEELAQYYRENGNYSSAISTVTKALQKDSSNARLWDVLGILHIENGDTVRSLQSLERSVDIYPQPDVVISLGILYAQTKNKKALAVADGLLMADKARAEKEALFIRGMYYNAVGEKEKAIELFNQCLAMNYSFMEAYREKAIAQYDLGKYKESIETLQRATTLQNNFDEGYYFMGRALEKLKDIPRAIEAYQTALMYDPNYIEARDALGKLGVK